MKGSLRKNHRTWLAQIAAKIAASGGVAVLFLLVAIAVGGATCDNSGDGADSGTSTADATVRDAGTTVRDAGTDSVAPVPDVGSDESVEPDRDGGSSPDVRAAADVRDHDHDSSLGTMPSLPICVWNQAYEETGNNDSVSAILAGAKGCYVLIDPFDSKSARDGIAKMKQNDNTVGCYISVGSCEDWRDDFDAMKQYCTEPYPDWPGEYFVTDTEGILPLMKARVDKMAGWGCDMVEFDNMDWEAVDEDEADAYIRALSAYTHDKGMQVMAKSTTIRGKNLDGLTVESYVDDKDWWETRELETILDADKLGVIVHYNDDDCDGVYDDYKQTYGKKLSFICSDDNGYHHYN